MNIESKNILSKEKLDTLHHLKTLLEENDEKFTKEVNKIVKDVLLRKEDTGTVIFGDDHILKTLAVHYFETGRYNASRSALALLGRYNGGR